jgi:prophage tail gpP-like protein
MADKNILTLEVNGKAFSGWEAVRVTRGIERCPSDFDLLVTERNPFDPGTVSIEPGQTCQVKIGGDLVLTGYVDRYTGSITPSQHQVRIQGRSKCEDLVDCSAGFFADGSSRGMSMRESSLVDMANKLASPFKITAKSLTGDNVPIGDTSGNPIQFTIMLDETPYEIIERVAAYASVLAYDDTDGNLLLSRVGSRTAASGFSQGVNVQAAAVGFALDDRYSLYIPRLFNTDDLQNGVSGQVKFQSVTDAAVPRFRPLAVVTIQNDQGQPLVERRALWERNRRYGRSQPIRVTCDSWRDTSGALWEPNTFAPVDIPALKIVKQNWIISQVSFIRDASRGTVADLVLMPPAAFDVAPAPLPSGLFDWQVQRELQKNGGAASATDATSFR